MDNHRLTFDGDSVTGIAYFTAHHLYEEDGRWQSLLIILRSHDAYARTDGGWKFASRRLELQWTTTVDAALTPFID